MVTYRLARPEEKDAVIAFMDTHWGTKHPILHHPAYFDYYFDGKDTLRFALAIEDGEICAVCGYTPCSESGEDIWISLWQAKKGMNGVGLELMSQMLRLTGAARMSCNNIREKTRPLYHFIGYETGELHQYYRLADRAHYTLAEPDGTPMPAVDPTVRLEEVTDFTELERHWAVVQNCVPKKDLWYLRRRYADFPGYRGQYHFYALRRDAAITALLVVRDNPVGDTCVLRIVDWAGTDEDLALIGGTVDALLTRYHAEYVDFYCAGIPDDVLHAAGFVLRGRDSKAIIPNYLNPPLRANTDYFYFTTQSEGFRMFRADGDQDRPNLPEID